MARLKVDMTSDEPNAFRDMGSVWRALKEKETISGKQRSEQNSNR